MRKRKVISDEQFNAIKEVANKFGLSCVRESYAFVHKDRGVMIYPKDMNLDDKHRQPTSRDEKGMLVTESKRFISYHPNSRRNKWVYSYIYWNDQRYQELWRTGVNGYWDCFSTDSAENFEFILKRFEHSAMKIVK